MLKKLSHFIDSGENSSNSYKKDKAHLHESFDFLALIRSWKEIAGAKLAEHTIPLKNNNGTLVILSNHSAIANELSYMELPLKKKIFEKFPTLEKSILSIKFIVDTTHFSKQYEQFITPMEKKKAQTLHPFSPELRKLKREAEELFSEINDPEIKEKMMSLYIQTTK
jgi:mevalonate kinase